MKTTVSVFRSHENGTDQHAVNDVPLTDDGCVQIIANEPNRRARDGVNIRLYEKDKGRLYLEITTRVAGELYDFYDGPLPSCDKDVIEAYNQKVASALTSNGDE